MTDAVNNSPTPTAPLYEVKRDKRIDFLVKVIFLIGIVGLLVAVYTQSNFLTHNVAMEYGHKFFLYGTYAAAGLGIISALFIKMLHPRL